jgi:hypothetical protein
MLLNASLQTYDLIGHFIISTMQAAAQCLQKWSATASLTKAPQPRNRKSDKHFKYLTFADIFALFCRKSAR